MDMGSRADLSSGRENGNTDSMAVIAKLEHELRKGDFKFMPCPDIDLTNNEKTATAKAIYRLVNLTPDVGSEIQLKFGVTTQEPTATFCFQVKTCDPQRSTCPHDDWCSKTSCPSAKMTGYEGVAVKNESIVSFTRTGKETVTVVVDGNQETAKQIQVPSATWDDNLFLKIYLCYLAPFVHKARIISDDEGIKRVKDEIAKHHALIRDNEMAAASEIKRLQQVIENQSQELVQLKESVTSDQTELRSLIQESQQRLVDMEAEVDRLQNLLLTPTGDDTGSWLQTNSVTMTGESLIRRIKGNEGKNYSFRRTSFESGSKINIVVKEVDKSLEKSLTFGLTVFEPQTISLNSLPVTGAALKSSGHAGKWFVAEDMLNNVTKGKIVSIKRTGKGVVVASLTGEELVIEVDPHLKVFPFFLMDGCVSAVEVKNFEVRERKGTECLFCSEKPALVFAKPCFHGLYCNDCFEAAIITSKEKKPKCPLCGDEIADFGQIKMK